MEPLRRLPLLDGHRFACCCYLIWIYIIKQHGQRRLASICFYCIRFVDVVVVKRQWLRPTEINTYMFN